MSESIAGVELPCRRWTQVSWKRVLVALVLTFVCLAALLPIAWFLEPWYIARQLSRDQGSLSVTPVALPSTSASAIAPNRLQCFEFSFQTPWDKVSARKDYKSATVIRFANGAAILAFDPQSMPSFQKAAGKKAANLKEVFGNRALSSEYDWMATELAESPAQIHWWNRTGNVRAVVLLGLKDTEMLGSSAIYKVENDEVRGFQIGNPGPARTRVALELFDVNNRRYQVFISTQSPGPIITQADINAIVASFRPIPHS